MNNKLKYWVSIDANIKEKLDMFLTKPEYMFPGYGLCAMIVRSPENVGALILLHFAMQRSPENVGFIMLCST